MLRVFVCLCVCVSEFAFLTRLCTILNELQTTENGEKEEDLKGFVLLADNLIVEIYNDMEHPNKILLK